MVGTKAGALKTKQTLYEKYGKDYYVNMGRIGGKLGHTGGFATTNKNGVHMLAKLAGAKGGKISKRGKAKKYEITK